MNQPTKRWSPTLDRFLPSLPLRSVAVKRGSSRTLGLYTVVELLYRKMDVADLPAAFDVRLSTIENTVTLDELEEEYSITPETVAKAMETKLQGWLCEDSGRVVGFAMGERFNGEVQVVAVLPDYEGKGIGRNLLGRVTAWLFSEGYEEIWLKSNPDSTNRAYGFYRVLGWVATGSMIGEDEVLVLRKA